MCQRISPYQIQTSSNFTSYIYLATLDFSLYTHSRNKFVFYPANYNFVRQIIIFQIIYFSHHSLASSISSQLGCVQSSIEQFYQQHPFAFRYSAPLKSLILLLPIHKSFNLSSPRIFSSTIQLLLKYKYSSTTSLSTPFAVFRAELQCTYARSFAGALCVFQQINGSVMSSKYIKYIIQFSV
ncbi:Hypothetical_protein [Hexamita inflata]|uniref:Hypothetical_protein n=1 Tax=Hexamita inflata TaxID=28002 RepID=A0AA86N5C7_9EUKA|nr:Hypothetical protein HINF_LOCUS775 [Hexamita inflata]CAI9914852.1 Hypothetical protein HINF_LOCUS2497 [Hexamita inflata]